LVPVKSLLGDDYHLFREIELHHFSFDLHIFFLSKSQSRKKKDEAHNEDNFFSKESYFHGLPPLISPVSPEPYQVGGFALHPTWGRAPPLPLDGGGTGWGWNGL
jgi:hypothetical protein